MSDPLRALQARLAAEPGLPDPNECADCQLIDYRRASAVKVKAGENGWLNHPDYASYIKPCARHAACTPNVWVSHIEPEAFDAFVTAHAGKGWHVSELRGLPMRIT